MSNPNHFQWVKVYRSEMGSKSEFDLKRIKIHASKLCSGDYDIPLKFIVMNHRRSGAHVYKGEAIVRVNDIFLRNQRTWEIKNPSNKKIEGQLGLKFKNLEINYSFVEYLQGGMDISLICCVDFTGSNGIPSHPTSLHYLNPNHNIMNDYQKAILSVGEILLNYDQDKLVQTYGFGAKPIVNGVKGETSHFFPCSGDFNNCSGVGVEGVFDLYKMALNNIELSGPTYFAHLIREMRIFTEKNFAEDENTYTILLILTDGVIHDMSATKNEIVRASGLPLSIIIVGIGNEDFSMMDELDSDDQVNIFSKLFFKRKKFSKTIFFLFFLVTCRISRCCAKRYCSVCSV